VTIGTLTRVLDQTAAGVVITNHNGIIEYVNSAYEAITGFSRDEAIGRSPNLVRSGVQTPRFYETLWAAIRAGRPFYATLTNRARDGRLFQYEQTITPIVNDAGDITHYAAIGCDVTERHRTESARLLVQLEDEATRIAGLLHEGAGQFLALAHMSLADVSRNLTPADAAHVLEVRDYLDRIEQQLREVSRGIQPRIVSDLGLVEALRFLATGCESRHGVTVTVDAPLHLEIPASIESLLYAFVRDTLLNVGMHAGATRVSVALAREVNGRRAQDKTVTCAVQDNGIGFEVARLAALSGGALKSLQIRFAAIGGTVAIASTPGQGTEVCATVPVES
jgi:PAS domain S-box-containing protein